MNKHSCTAKLRGSSMTALMDNKQLMTCSSLPHSKLCSPIAKHTCCTWCGCRTLVAPAPMPNASYKMRMLANMKAMVWDEALDAPNTGVCSVWYELRYPAALQVGPCCCLSCDAFLRWDSSVAVILPDTALRILAVCIDLFSLMTDATGALMLD